MLYNSTKELTGNSINFFGWCSVNWERFMSSNWLWFADWQQIADSFCPTHRKLTPRTSTSKNTLSRWDFSQDSDLKCIRATVPQTTMHVLLYSHYIHKKNSWTLPIVACCWANTIDVSLDSLEEATNLIERVNKIIPIKIQVTKKLLKKRKPLKRSGWWIGISKMTFRSQRGRKSQRIHLILYVTSTLEVTY